MSERLFISNSLGEQIDSEDNIFKASQPGFRTHIYLLSYCVTMPFVLTWKDDANQIVPNRL